MKKTNKKVYIVCEEIDLGYHVDSIWTSKEKAEERCKALNKEYHNSFPKLSDRDWYFIEEYDLYEDE